VLLKKFFNVGFAAIGVVERSPFGLDDLERYPLFAPDFIDFLRRVIPPSSHSGVVFSIAITARKAKLRDHTSPASRKEENA
jgi:hypothetical protein